MKPVTSSSAVRQAAPVERSSSTGPARIRDALERTGILLVLAVLVVVFALREPAFLNLDNLFSILQAVSIVALLGVGVTVTLAAGGFDLSVGSVAATAQMA
ncbi:sugar ABC transporter permease, partial [Burkholderia cenocepacia]